MFVVELDQYSNLHFAPNPENAFPLAERRYVEVYPNGRWGWSLPVEFAMLPAEGSKVRVGYVRLSYGYAIITTAYQDSEGHVNIVIHGTIVNEIEFYDLAVKTLAYSQYYDEYSYYNLTRSYMEPTTIEVCERDKSLYIGRRTTFRVVPLWFPWRIVLPGSGYLEVNETTRIPIRGVYLLIEMPMLGAIKTSHLDKVDVFPGSPLSINNFLPRPLTGGVFVYEISRSFEPVYMALSHPVFGLASSFTRIDHETARGSP